MHMQPIYICHGVVVNNVMSFAHFLMSNAPFRQDITFLGPGYLLNIAGDGAEECREASPKDHKD